MQFNLYRTKSQESQLKILYISLSVLFLLLALICVCVPKAQNSISRA